MAEQILGLTLEIIYLLSGEDYTLVKRPEGRLTSSSGGRSNNQTLVMEPPPKSLLHLRDNEQKILEIINKILQMLTGEVPVRCEDVTVHLSIEEWEYLEGHKDQYKEVLMEEHQDLTPQDDVKVLELWCDDLPPDYDLECNEETLVLPSPPPLLQIEYEPPNPSAFLHPPVPPEMSKRFQCPDCGKFFISNSKLVRHRIMHTGEKPFPCPECNKSFKGRRHLLDHLKIHSGEKAHSCPQCDKIFSYKSNLIIHLRSHTGEKPFTCSHCGKSFVSNSKLVRHQRIHEVGRPFPCPQCDRCFAYESNLILHLRSHTGEKPYSCPDCGKCFVANSKLRRHQISHRGQSFSCVVCGRAFAYRRALDRHQASHQDPTMDMSRMWEMFTNEQSLGQQSDPYGSGSYPAV